MTDESPYARRYGVHDHGTRLRCFACGRLCRYRHYSHRFALGHWLGHAKGCPKYALKPAPDPSAQTPDPAGEPLSPKGTK